jgi:iron complex transport system ATP-binding protein
MVARALAQEPCVLVLDEPTNHLDIRHQLETLELIKDLPLTIITSLHDLNMAAEICDEVVILKDGRLLGYGVPGAVFSAEAISGTFEVAASHERLAPSDKSLLTFNLKN